MANIAERLFDQVLSQLPPPPETPEVSVSEGDYDEWDDQLDSPLDIGDEDLVAIGGIAARDRVMDPIFGKETAPELSDEHKELIDAGIEARGFDAIAFYKSRRFIAKKPCPGRWGIFYISEGIGHVAWLISKDYPTYGDPVSLARDFLRAHEHHHFCADLRTLMFEATLRRHLYIPARQRFRGMRNSFVEEAIANRCAYNWSKRPQIGLKDFAHDFMMLQPGAYARFLEPLDGLAGEWAANIVDGQGPHCAPRYDLSPWVRDTPPFIRLSLCPEYLINPKFLKKWVCPGVVVTVREVIAALQRHYGYREVSGSKHIKLEKPGFRPIELQRSKRFVVPRIIKQILETVSGKPQPLERIRDLLVGTLPSDSTNA